MTAIRVLQIIKALEDLLKGWKFSGAGKGGAGTHTTETSRSIAALQRKWCSNWRPWEDLTEVSPKMKTVEVCQLHLTLRSWETGYWPRKRQRWLQLCCRAARWLQVWQPWSSPGSGSISFGLQTLFPTSPRISE